MQELKTGNTTPKTLGTIAKMFRSIGPSIIVASIVLGPGSVMTSSKVGCQFGYSMLWVLAAAIFLMIGMTALGAYLGALVRNTPCGELASIAGRPAAAALGVLVFVIIACFQSSNNAAVLASIEGLAEGTGEGSTVSNPTKMAILAAMNGLIIATMYGFRSLYRPLELLMTGLVLAMLLAFSVNLMFAAPSPSEILQGFIPSLPAAAESQASQQESAWALLGLVATTFSVAGAFYQCYLVKEKGWTEREVRRGLVDSFTGILLLGLVSGVIMVTSAAALHGRVPVGELTSASAIAKQLEPFFGSSATLLFSFGIFAAALSSFLGNALIGGTVLSDGLGLGNSIDQAWPRRLTVLALLTGMAIACYTMIVGNNAVNVIVLAQALTVLGVPLLAGLMLWFAVRINRAEQRIPFWVILVGSIGGVTTLVLAIRTLRGLLAS